MPDRLRHHRLRDHTGSDSTLFVVLNDPLGPFDADTPIQYVLEALIASSTSLESTTKVLNGFDAKAIVLAPGAVVGPLPPGTMLGVFMISAVLFNQPLPTFTANAWLTEGGSFSVDAVLRGYGSFTASARIL